MRNGAFEEGCHVSKQDWKPPPLRPWYLISLPHSQLHVSHTLLDATVFIQQALLSYYAALCIVQTCHRLWRYFSSLSNGSDSGGVYWASSCGKQAAALWESLGGYSCGCSSRGWIWRCFMVSAEGPRVPHLLGWAAEDDMNVVHYCVSLHLLYYRCRISRRFLLGVMVDTKASKFTWAVTYEKCHFCWRTRVPLSVWLILYH